METGAILLLLARILVGGAFIAIGVRLLRALPLVADLLAAKGIPLPRLVARSGGMIEIALGMRAISGLRLFETALAMAVFVMAATLMVHDVWNARGPQRVQELNVVLSNTIIVGGLLALAGAAR